MYLPIEEADFQELVTRLLPDELLVYRLAVRCQVAQSTVTRWAHGTARPAPRVRALIAHEARDLLC
jgi:hypothetical protein